jgi:hypothetical protein
VSTLQVKFAEVRLATNAGMIPEDWEGPPRWLDLQPTSDQDAHSQPKILVAYELLSVQDAELGDVCSNISPPTLKCTLRFFLIGIRLADEALFDMEPSIIFTHCKSPSDVLGQTGRREVTRE